jgi:hypothetical protein
MELNSGINYSYFMGLSRLCDRVGLNPLPRTQNNSFFCYTGISGISGVFKILDH